MNKAPVIFRLNGNERAEFVEPGSTLLTLLRDKIGDTTPKGGCLQGTCGACTIHVDGAPRLACLTLAEDIDRRQVETLRGLSGGDGLHPIQKAFVEAFATQCGFCTPGMIMAAKALLERNPAPDRSDVVEAISGNICRCTGYEPIITAILDAAARNSASAAEAA